MMNKGLCGSSFYVFLYLVIISVEIFLNGYCYCEIEVNYLKYKVENAKHLGLSNFIWLLIAVPIQPINHNINKRHNITQLFFVLHMLLKVVVSDIYK